MIVWPDIVIGAIALIAVLKGYKRGFIAELAGAIALFAALTVPFWYNGSLDSSLSSLVHLGPGSARVVGLFLVGLATYIAIMLLSWLLSRFARVAFLGVGNALAGATVGLLKAGFFLWAVLYIGLLFPLTSDLRDDLHRSRLVILLSRPDERIDAAINGTLPWFVRPLLHPILERHRV
ncbi:MAG: CvpA family protein [Candidatus Eremiobacteraeota bacterium]|nr:CvpA family protein [Candidatus Eremiobacteraeota bacterium]